VNTNSSFHHAGLAAAAPRLQRLQQAGAAIGSPDPIAALRHIDCSPPDIDTLAKHVGDGANQIDTAHGDYSKGRTTALTGWTGRAADDFAQRTAKTDARYGTTHDDTESIHSGGLNVAAGLDGLANTAADQATQIAQQNDQACSVVLAGPAARGYPEAAVTVNQACLDVVNVVSAQIAKIPDLEDYLTVGGSGDHLDEGRGGDAVGSPGAAGDTVGSAGAGRDAAGSPGASGDAAGAVGSAGAARSARS
jgi:uncharacterized protein YukE